MVRIAVCGGVHANPYALRALLDDVRERGCDELYCLGELGDPGACEAEVDAIRALLSAHGVRTIAGDHDIRREIEAVDVHMVRGSPLAVDDGLWESLDDEEVARRVAASGAAVLVCAHTGIPWQREVAGTLVVNAGAVGRPANDGRTETWYAVLDLEAGRARAELVPLAYDWRAQAAAMRAARRPEALAESIETGWWTTGLEAMPPAERARGAYQIHHDGRPTELFGTPLFPPRLWVYTNFHCNLACDYCVVESSPHARRRELPAWRVRSLVDEALREGFTELYMTGGEPFVHPDIFELIEYASDRMTTVVLTNAMLFTGRRRAELARLAGRPALTLQSSIDGARAATHDRWRGAGSWARAMDGLRYAAGLGLPLRVAMTETPHNRDEVEELRGALAELGIGAEDVAVRPLVRRGFAAGAAAAGAQVVCDAVMVPELTITADGAHWHPVGGDVGASPDFLVARGEVALAEAKRRVVERFLALHPADGASPDAFRCAV